MRRTHPPRKAPTGLRAGKGVAVAVASASDRGVAWKLRVMARRGAVVAEMLRAPPSNILEAMVDVMAEPGYSYERELRELARSYG